MKLKLTRVALALLAVSVLVGAAPDHVRAAEADYNHVSITSSAPPESVRWYAEHLGCETVADRDDTADCFGVEVTFVPQPTMGSTQGTGVNHIGFSYADLTAKMGELEAVGVHGRDAPRVETGQDVRLAGGDASGQCHAYHLGATRIVAPAAGRQASAGVSSPSSAGAMRSSTKVFHSWHWGHCQSSSVLR